MADPDGVSADEPTPEQSGGEPQDCSPPPETSGCEPGVDELNCIAEGDAAKSAYHRGFKADLDKAKADYETARESYADARRKSAPLVADLQNQIKHLLERIRCQIEQKRIWRCLDDAWCEVQRELKCCPQPTGCCIGECEFPIADLDKKSTDELTAVIADYQQQIDAAKKCFADLLGEATRLTDEVEAAKKAVADLNAVLSGDQATLDLKKAYAEALVADWKVDSIWNGFNHVQDYVDCLCQALTCWTKGCSAVYVLVGAQAVAACKDKAKQERCAKLRSETAKQILARYERLCPTKTCEDSDDTENEPDEDVPDDFDDCGCHHHHHHHHHPRRRRCGCGCEQDERRGGCGCD